MIIKPNRSERIVITIVASIAIGMIIGVLSTKTEIEDLKFENKLLILHVEEMTEMMDQMMRMDRHLLEEMENNGSKE